MIFQVHYWPPHPRWITLTCEALELIEPSTIHLDEFIIMIILISGKKTFDIPAKSKNSLSNISAWNTNVMSATLAVPMVDTDNILSVTSFMQQSCKFLWVGAWHLESNKQTALLPPPQKLIENHRYWHKRWLLDPISSVQKGTIQDDKLGIVHPHSVFQYRRTLTNAAPAGSKTSSQTNSLIRRFLIDWYYQKMHNYSWLHLPNLKVNRGPVAWNEKYPFLLWCTVEKLKNST